ncbi:unnamed protein product [Pseudo-nitzschia multistriata]|uniref:DDE Tnp4 domain-containing protein n=1 Tax=Pseudo-nitzschia multistriata TaxID=183589 RepID=A0A448Z5C4_9STRA|nr:unnamed protein product [Pseudo-nitzschia multistriata]
MDHKVFRELVDLFAPVWNKFTVNNNNEIVEVPSYPSGKPKGKKREVDAVCAIGLVLYWYRTRGSVARSMAMAFGLTSTVMYKWLKFARRVLLVALHKHPDAMVSVPTEEEVNVYVNAIGEKYPRLGEKRVWAAADGLKSAIEASEDWFKQRAFYNAWKENTFVNSVFVFAPDGRIRISVFNCPGAWHDSAIADHGVYDRIEEVHTQSNAKVVVDSAFALKDKEHILIKSSQHDPEQEDLLLINRDATSLRQMSEWGMRMIQGQFPRIKDRMFLEEHGDRKIIMSLLVNLYNYQCSNIGHNQILSTFMKTPAATEADVGSPYQSIDLARGFFHVGREISPDANGLF